MDNNEQSPRENQRAGSESIEEVKIANRRKLIRNLSCWEEKAELGYKLKGDHKRLIAAFHLSRAWREANSKGLRKEEFQDLVLEKLKWAHRGRKAFKLANWVLRKDIEAVSENVVQMYKGKSTPQKALEPYLVGVAVAADYCEKDPDDWKLDLVAALGLPKISSDDNDIKDDNEDGADCIPQENLALSMKQLCRWLAQKNHLDATFRAIRSMNCRWEMFDERLVATDDVCMEPIDSPISPYPEVGVYFEEMFPFPSVSLLLVPYLTLEAEFTLAPDDMLRALDRRNQSGDAYVATGLGLAHGAHNGLYQNYCVPDNAPSRRQLRGKLVYYRDVRLCIVPDGHGDFTAALESRPAVEVTFPEESDIAGRYSVHGAYEPGVINGLFYARTPEGENVWPTITVDGRAWRIQGSNNAPVTNPKVRDPKGAGWEFDADPVQAPRDINAEPWYLSYTRATPDYLAHWLIPSWQLADEWAICPWQREGFDQDDPESDYDRNLPPIHELNFPQLNNATCVESCLHNGLIKKALQASIDRLTQQTDALERQWKISRDTHTQNLLERWSVLKHKGTES